MPVILTKEEVVRRENVWANNPRTRKGGRCTTVIYGMLYFKSKLRVLIQY